MVQRIKVQSGKVIYEASDSAYDMNMDVLGRVNVTKEVRVGNDPLADGLISTENNTSLILAPGVNGDIKLQTSGTGNIVINNVVWPTTAANSGRFLGVTSLNTLEFLDPIVGSVGTDSATSSYLNSAFSAAYPGQQVLGPNVVYQKVNSTQWRIMSALPYVPLYTVGGALWSTMLGPLYLSGSPTDPLQAATKQYVDDIASGLNAHGACETGTVAALPACTYNNGSAGVGATLTANSNGAIGAVGGYSTLSVGSRVLVKNQSNAIQNGIYVVTQLGSASTPWILTRSTDFDGSPVSEVTAGDFVYVQEGSLSGTQWVQITVGSGTSGGHDYVVIGTDNLVFTQLSGSGTYTGGTGINVASNIITNTGVTSATAGSGISLSGSTGNIIISGTGGTVTSVGLTSSGSGISITGGPITTNGVISIANTGVTSTTAGSGISLSGSTGSVTIANTGVTSLTAGSNVSLSGSTGNITISVSGTLPTATTATNLAGGLATQIPFQSAPSTTTFDSGLTYTVGTGTLSVGSATTGVVSSQSGQALEIQSDISISFKTSSVTRATIDSSGNFTVNNNETINGNLIRSVNPSITATGSTLATAAVLTKDINVVSTVTAGTGVSLPASNGGMTIIVMNTGGNILNVYPNSASSQIDSLGLGSAFSLPVGARIMFISVTSSQWYTLNATYS